MVKKVSGSGTVKMLVVMFLVFVVSFLLTVNAFAEWSIKNPNYYGTYRSNRSIYGFVDVKSNKVSVIAYYHVFDTGNTDYLSGSSEDGKLASHDYVFTINNYTICDRDGNPQRRVVGTVTILGTTDVDGNDFSGMTIKSITLIPAKQTTLKYKK